MILWTTILNKLEKNVNSNELRFIDIRYLDKWIKKFPHCFPKFIIQNNHKIIFNSNKLRYEFSKK